MYIRVSCERCGRSFEVYNLSDITNKGRKCPHCQERVNASAWGKVVKAYVACCEANLALYRDDTSKTRFTVDFLDNTYYKVRDYNSPNLD